MYRRLRDVLGNGRRKGRGLMGIQPGQIEMTLPELDRPRFVVQGEHPNGRTMESKPFDTEKEAQEYKKLLQSVAPTMTIKIKKY